jgi:hypothetical protein
MARGGAIAHYLQMVSGIASTDLDIDYQFQNQRWLPRSWVLTYRNISSGKITTIDKVRAEVIDVNPSVDAADFSIEDRPGARVVVLEHKLQHPSRADTEQIATKLFSVQGDGSWVPIGTTRGYGWLWAVAVAVAGVTTGWAVWRRRNRQREGTPHV